MLESVRWQDVLVRFLEPRSVMKSGSRCDMTSGCEIHNRDLLFRGFLGWEGNSVTYLEPRHMSGGPGGDMMTLWEIKNREVLFVGVREVTGSIGESIGTSICYGKWFERWYMTSGWWILKQDLFCSWIPQVTRRLFVFMSFYSCLKVNKPVYSSLSVCWQSFFCLWLHMFIFCLSIRPCFHVYPLQYTYHVGITRVSSGITWVSCRYLYHVGIV